MLSRKFKKFLKQGKFKCFNYSKTGHMKKDCLLLKNKRKFKSKRFKKKKDYQASWENSDSSSFDEEEATEHANICFMAQGENEVLFGVHLCIIFTTMLCFIRINIGFLLLFSLFFLVQCLMKKEAKQL